MSDSLDVIDRYDVLGPPNGCDGPCEGTGAVPVKVDDEDETLRDLWWQAEYARPTDDGWHFVPCPTCSPNERRSDA